MAEQLKTAERHLTKQVPHMQRIGRWVEPHVRRQRTTTTTGIELGAVRAVVDQTAGRELPND